MNIKVAKQITENAKAYLILQDQQIKKIESYYPDFNEVHPKQAIINSLETKLKNTVVSACKMFNIESSFFIMAVNHLAEFGYLNTIKMLQNDH